MFSRPVLRCGRLAASGETTSIIAAYLSEARRENKIALVDWTDRITSGEARITKLEVGDDAAGNQVAFGQDFRFRIHATFKEPLADPTFGLIIHDVSGVPLANVQSIHQGLQLGRVDGNIIIDGVIPKINLYPGRYFLSPWIMDSAVQRDVDFPRMCAELNILPTPGPHGDLKLDSTWGKYFLPSVWKSAQT